ncbi:hypothetical protein [Halococcoides cellulosivorans]|uniref:hypothetical protein n=1 Tax=Halococcoides cellulosivorans TaxID=1679096 RepID=UPI00131EEAD6|nr:hypothetical protein [Halococcoides cellulosivorans]
MDEVYLDEFAEDYPDSPANFYDMKAHAALALDDDRATTYVAELRDAIEVTDDPSLYWETIPEFYAAVLDGSTADVEAALADLHDFFVSEAPNPDDPSEYVLDDVAASVVLARRHGLDPMIESDRVPEAVLREEIPADDPTLDIDIDSLQFTSDVGFFELERDDEDRPVIAGRIYHPGGEPVSADDVPEREAGRVLSDGWIEAALDEAEWREHYDDAMVAEAREAYEDGTLQRKLVVVQDRTDGHTFDESLAALPVDDVAMLKGAGR